ncbi:MAG: peptidylprolyl isomerase [bacterium]
MNRSFSRHRAGMACATLLAALLASQAGCGKKESGGPDAGAVVAKVNGHKIHDKELVREIGQMNTMIQQQGGQPPMDAAGMAEIRQNAINNLVDKRLLMERVDKEGIAPTDAEVDAEVAKVKSQYPDEASFAARLAQLSMSDADLRNEIRFNVGMQRVAAKHQDAVPEPSPEEARKYYDENRPRFLEPPGIRASHILIRANRTDPDSLKLAARARADAALAQIKGGSDFAAVATEKSEDTGSAPNGGDVGFFSRGRMVPEFESAAFALEVGDVSPVVETQFGYHIIKVTDKRDEREVPFEEVQDQVIQMLGQTKGERIVRALIEESRKSAKIEITGGNQPG